MFDYIIASPSTIPSMDIASNWRNWDGGHAKVKRNWMLIFYLSIQFKFLLQHTWYHPFKCWAHSGKGPILWETMEITHLESRMCYFQGTCHKNWGQENRLEANNMERAIRTSSGQFKVFGKIIIFFYFKLHKKWMNLALGNASISHFNSKQCSFSSKGPENFRKFSQTYRLCWNIFENFRR